MCWCYQSFDVKDVRNVQREICFLEVLSEGRGPSLAVVCVVVGDALYFSSVTAFFCI